jgi:hypothetical protein
MLATALAIQEATSEAVHEEMVMDMASMLYHHRNDMSGEDFAKALFQYSAMLSSVTATLVTQTLLTEDQLDAMLNDINEFDKIGKDITNGTE